MTAGWIPVEERLPKDHTHVVILSDGGLARTGWFDSSVPAWYGYDVIGSVAVTHWIPLPELTHD